MESVLGSMFVDFQNFVGNWFVALHLKPIHYFVKRLMGRKFVGKGNRRKQRTLIFHEY